MRFQVRRTSQHGDDESPCAEATRGFITRVDVRVHKHPVGIPMWKALGKSGAMEAWLSEGTNHRTLQGNIARDMGQKVAWYVDIPDLVALLAFQEKYGDLVLQASWDDPEVPCIEIYDGYRE